MGDLYAKYIFDSFFMATVIDFRIIRSTEIELQFVGGRRRVSTHSA